MKWIIRGVVCLGFFFGSLAFGQTPSQNGVPFISQVTPPSLQPPTTPPPPGNFTLTIEGANFPSNATVKLVAFGSYTIPAVSTLVNPNGSRIVAQFPYAALGSPTVMTVTVTNPNGDVPVTSSPFYLPMTPAMPSIALSANVRSPLSGSATGIVVASISNPELLDLAILSQTSNTVSLLSGNFGGTFTAGPTYSTGQGPSGIVAVDFFRDGMLGLAITNAIDRTVTILLPNGGGTLRDGDTISLPGAHPSQLVVGDFDGDGKLDLAVLNTCGTNSTSCPPQSAPAEPGTVTILLGNGNGTFTVSPVSLTAGMAPYAIATADLNGDGFLDLVVANSMDNNVTILMGNGDGTFVSTAASPATGNGPMSLVVGDFNGDGNLDLAVANATDGTVSVLLNQNCPSVAKTQCSFAAAPPAPAVGSSPVAIATGDLNADGFMDLVVANGSSNSVSVLLGDGTGKFQAVADGDFSTGTLPYGVVIGDFNQDGRFDIATSNAEGSYSVLQQAAVAQAVLTTNNPSTYYGLFVTFTAQVNPSFGVQPTGSVTFMDGSTPIGTVALNGYQASLDYPFLSTGSHQVTAVYNGDNNFVLVTSNAVAENVTPGQTTLTLTSDLRGLSYGQPVTFTATITPQNYGTATGSITFTDTTANTVIGSAALSNNVATLTVSNLSAGDHNVAASYQGDSNFLGSSASSLPVTIFRASTAVLISSNLNPAAWGQSPVFTATVQPGAGNTATGTISFIDNGTVLGTVNVANNSAQYTDTSIPVGAHAVSAQYNGDATFAGSTSNYLQQTVNPAPSSATVSLSSSATNYGQAVTITATVHGNFGGGAPTGTLSFFDGSTGLAIVQLANGSAQFTSSTLSPGNHAITAQYAGDANFTAATSSQQTLTVSQANTTLTISSGTNPATYSQAVVLSATIQTGSGTGPTGSVTFLDGSTNLGVAVVFNGVAQLTASSLNAGAHSITGRYSGDANFSASTSVAFNQTVNQAGTTTSAASNLNPASFGQGVTITASVQGANGSPTGSVTFFDSGASLGTVNLAGGAAQITLAALAAGAHSITAKYNGESNFVTSTSPAVAQNVNRASTATVVMSSLNPSSYGQSVSFTATVTPAFGGSPSGTVTFFDGSATLGSANLTSGTATIFTAATTLAAGSHSVTATYSGDASFVASTSAVSSQSVTPAATATTLTSSASPSLAGQPVTFTAHVSSAASGSLTGTVSFYLDGGPSPLASVAVSGGNAQYTTNSLSVGTHTLSAVFSSTNANFSGSSSGALGQAVSDFSISLSPTSKTIGRNSSGTSTVTVTPAGGFTGAVTLSCSGAPTNTTCSVSPAQVSLGGTNSSQSVVTVTTNNHATKGTYNLTVSGSSGPLAHSAGLTLVVTN